MRIGNTGYPQPSTRQTSTPAFSVSGSTASTTTSGAPNTPSVGQVDFSHMTRKDLFNWMNKQITSGKMTIDESTPFFAMSMSVPVEGNDLQGSNDATELIDFLDKVKKGLAGAQSRGDSHEAQMLLDTLNAMEQSKSGGSAVRSTT